MKIQITQLLNGLEDSSVPMEEPDVVSVMRIKELTKNKINQAERKPHKIVKKRGLSFQLSVKGSGYDLLSLAESVLETDNYPPMDSDTRLAIEELGDWNLTFPEDYTELATNGVSGNDAYVSRT